MPEQRQPITADRIISMTELQKLSLRRLREMRLDEAPLLVRDSKRHQKRFVILDHVAYERLVSDRDAGRQGRGAGECGKPGLGDVDFAHHGLLWDRPTMTNERFAEILADADDPDHRWALARVLERLPSRIVTRSVPLTDLRRVVSLVKLRQRVREAWEGAIEFWTEEARRRLA